MELNDRERIGVRVRELRTQKGLSYRALAEISGVSYPNIVKIENGRYNVSIDILSKITSVLCARIDLVDISDDKLAL